MTRKERSTWIMRKAWQLAKAGAERFGGKAREYLGASIRQAWAMFREMTAQFHPLAQTLDIAAALTMALFGIKTKARNEHAKVAIANVRAAAASVVAKVSGAFKSFFRNASAPVAMAVATASTGTGHHPRE